MVLVCAVCATGRPLSGERIGPSAASLVDAGSDGRDWPLPGRTYAGNRYVRGASITPANVRRLARVWTYRIPETATMEAAPIVWNGMLFATSGNDGVYALDARTGAERWRYAYPVAHAIAFWVNRGVAVYDGKVFFGTLSGHLVALDAATGRVLWDVVGVDDPKTSFYAMAPVPYKDVVLIGASNGDWGGNGSLIAFSAETGRRVWEWKTIPGPGEPGHETWSGDSWKTGGGSIWAGMAIDPASETIYVDVGNPEPDLLGTARRGTNLYTDSMVALDVSGAHPRVRWYHQFTPHDTHDWDAAAPPVLFTAEIDGRPRALAATGDKGGNVWVLDAHDGRLVAHAVVSTQRGADAIPDAAGTVTCPATNGGVQYNGGAYLAETHAYYVPSIDQCATFRTGAVTNPADQDLDLGGPIPTIVGPSTGWMNAVDVPSGRLVWRRKLTLPGLGGALALGTGLVFSGELDGTFDAYDARTGDVLWSFPTGSPISAPPSSYVLDGREYVVVASGDANANFVLPGEPATNAGALISAFALP